MLIDALNWILRIAGLYIILGLFFGLPFAARGAARIDGNAREGSWGFRLLILPGAIALWPLLAMRWLRSSAARGAGLTRSEAEAPGSTSSEASITTELRRPDRVRRIQSRLALALTCSLPFFVAFAIFARPTVDPLADSGGAETGSESESEAWSSKETGLLTEGSALARLTIPIEAFSGSDEHRGAVEAAVFYAKAPPEGLVLELLSDGDLPQQFGPDALVYWQRESGDELRASAWLLGRLRTDGKTRVMLPRPAGEEAGQVVLINGLDASVLGKAALEALGSR